MVRCFRIATTIGVISIASLMFTETQTAHAAKRMQELVCDFDEGSAADWDSGKLKIEGGRFGKNGATRYTSIDLAKRTAVYVTDAGSEDVSIIPSPKGLSFVEVLPTGLSIATV